jgi:molybdopterin-biosynthesis enzyme MoeA-like protein
MDAKKIHPPPLELDIARSTATAAIVLVGEELLLDPSMDCNGPFLIKQLLQVGIRTREMRILPDRSSDIQQAINSLRSHHTYVFVSGGLGPTHDDVTATALSLAFRVPLHTHPDAIALLQSFYLDAGIPESRIRTARVPVGSEIIEDPISGTPGFRIGNVFVMAGSPEILQCMFRSIAHLLRHGTRLHSRSLKVAAVESQLADELALLQHLHPAVQIGSYPYFPHGGPAVNVVMRSTDVTVLKTCVRDLRALIDRLGCLTISGENSGRRLI